MLAAVLTRDGFRLDERPLPTPDAGQLLVRSEALGICEGDVYHYRQRKGLAAEQVLGHEGTGVVVGVGAGVTGFREGDRVTTLGGPYAEAYTVQAEMAVPVPEGLEPIHALGEPIACCVHAAARFGVHPGDRVAMIGCGFMGLVCMQLARMQGAAEVVAVEPMPWRRETAHELGADSVYGPEEDLSSFGAFDVVLEATGVQGGLDLVGPLVREHGRAVLIGYHQSADGQRKVDMRQWNYKAIDIINGHVRRNDEKLEAARASLALLQAGLLRVGPLVTAYSLPMIGQAFDDLVARKKGLYKAVLVP